MSRVWSVCKREHVCWPPGWLASRFANLVRQESMICALSAKLLSASCGQRGSPIGKQAESAGSQTWPAGCEPIDHFGPSAANTEARGQRARVAAQLDGLSCSFQVLGSSWSPEDRSAARPWLPTIVGRPTMRIALAQLSTLVAGDDRCQLGARLENHEPAEGLSAALVLGAGRSQCCRPPARPPARLLEAERQLGPRVAPPERAAG